MKIGIVLSGTPAYSETFFRNKIRFLKEAGFIVTLYIEQAHPDFDLCPVKIGYHTGNGKLKDYFSLWNAILRLCLNPGKSIQLFQLNKSDGIPLKLNLLSMLRCAHIIHANPDWLHFGFATMAIGRENIAKTIGSKMAVSIRGYDIIMYPLKHPGCYRLLWKKLDKLHYISDDLLTLAKTNGFDDSVTSSVKITPAIDTNQFTPVTITTNHRYVFTTTARLNWKKGLEYTLEALALLKQLHVDFEFRIIGEGQEKERLIFTAHQLGIAGNVQFLGKKQHQEIIQILSETNIYIQYSINEGFCNSVLEAQAMGCFCIVSNAEGLSENVLHNQTGWVIPKRNPKLLLEAIQKALVMDNEERHQITNNAKRRVAEEFNLGKQKQAFIQFYANDNEYV